MPTIAENRDVWNESYDWSQGGTEWSAAWGSARLQWYGSILPRISAFVPAGRIVEIAPGFGRWTHYLKDLCDSLTVVDLSPRCIEACRERFGDNPRIDYHVNDGQSLAMIPDASVDFVFSFDSLVHAEEAVLRSYCAEIARILRPEGAAFIHHSNLGAYQGRVALQHQLSRVPELVASLRTLGVYEDIFIQWRARSMSASRMSQFANEFGLACIGQELVNWNTRTALIDCMTTLVPRGSTRWRDNRVVRNPTFMREARQLANLSPLYGPH